VAGVQSCDGDEIRQCNANQNGYSTAGICDLGETCLGAECVPVVCEASASTCVLNSVVTCNATGTDSSVTPCGAQACVDGACVDPTCEAGIRICSGGEVLECNASNSGYFLHERCDGDEVCVDESCQLEVCSAGTRTCLANTAIECNGTGTGTIATDCESLGQVCVAGGCTDPVCLAGTTICDGDNVMQCNERQAGHFIADVCGTGRSCIAGVCVNQICAPNSVRCELDSELACDVFGTSLSTRDCQSLGQYCSPGVGCDDYECIPGGEPFCDGQQVVECNERGSGTVLVEVCAEDEACSNGFCQGPICTPFDASCVGDNRVVCSEDGNEQMVTNCQAFDSFCDDGVCIPRDCDPDDPYYCQDGDVLGCHERGTGIVVQDDCGPHEGCTEGECLPMICNPGDAVCGGDATLQVCNSNGTGYVVEDCVASGGFCDPANQRCASPVCLPGNCYLPDAKLTGVNPCSPGTTLTPVLQGEGTPGVTLRVYTTADCSGDPRHQGEVDGAGDISFTTTVEAQSTTRFYWTFQAPADGEPSSCQGGIEYVHDACGAPPGPGWNVWTGSHNDEWWHGGNWSLGHIPTSAENVYICGTAPNSPRMRNTYDVNNLRVVGANLNLNNATLRVYGDLEANGIYDSGGSGRIELRGNGVAAQGCGLPSVVAYGTSTLEGTLEADAWDMQTSARVDLGANRMEIDGSATVRMHSGLNSGIHMHDPSAELIFNGTTSFQTQSGSSNAEGAMTAGTVRFRGAFTSTYGGCCGRSYNGFRPGPGVRTFIDGAGTQSFNMAYSQGQVRSWLGHAEVIGAGRTVNFEGLETNTWGSLTVRGATVNTTRHSSLGSVNVDAGTMRFSGNGYDTNIWGSVSLLRDGTFDAVDDVHIHGATTITDSNMLGSEAYFYSDLPIMVGTGAYGVQLTRIGDGIDLRLPGDRAVPGGMQIDGSRSLDLNGFTLTVGGHFQHYISNVFQDGLRMDNPNSRLILNGTSDWDSYGGHSGATTEGQLSAGIVYMRDDVFMRGGCCGASSAVFASTGTLVIFDGLSDYRIFMDTGNNHTPWSYFDDVIVRVPDGVTFDFVGDHVGDDTWIRGDLTLEGDADVFNELRVDGNLTMEDATARVIGFTPVTTVYGSVTLSDRSMFSWDGDMYVGGATLVQHASQLLGGRLHVSTDLPVIDESTYVATATEVWTGYDLVLFEDRTLPATTNIEVYRDASLDLNGHTLDLGGSYRQIISEGRTDGLIMRDPDDLFIVEGNINADIYGGHDQATTVGQLTHGELRLRGNFHTQGGCCGASRLAFNSTGTLMTFDGQGDQTITWNDYVADGMYWQDVRFLNPDRTISLTNRHMTFLGDVLIDGPEVRGISGDSSERIYVGGDLTIQNGGEFDMSQREVRVEGDTTVTSGGQLVIGYEIETERLVVSDATINIADLWMGSDLPVIDNSDFLVTRTRIQENHTISLPADRWLPSTSELRVDPTRVLLLNGHQLHLYGDLESWTSNQTSDGVRLLDPNDELIVEGKALWTATGGASAATTLGNLTDGVLRLRGGMDVRGGCCGSGRQVFYSTGTHVVVEGPRNQTINMDGNIGEQSRWWSMDVTSEATITLLGDHRFASDLNVMSGRVNAHDSNDFTVSGDFVVDNAMFDADNRENMLVQGTVTVRSGGELLLGKDLFIDETVTVTEASRLDARNVDVGSRLPLIDDSVYNVTETRIRANRHIFMDDDYVLPATTNLGIYDQRSVTLNGHTLTLGGNLSIRLSNFTNDGMRMVHPDDVLYVDGRVYMTTTGGHSAATSIGQWSHGTIYARGNFDIGAGCCGAAYRAFVSTGTEVVFDGFGQQWVEMHNSGGGANSHFTNVVVANPTGVHFNRANTTISGSLEVLAGARVNTLQSVRGLDMLTLRSGAVLNNQTSLTTDACTLEPGHTIFGPNPCP